MNRIRAILARLRRLHPLTWIVLVLSGAMMTLVIVPAGYQREYFNHTERPRTWWDRQCHAVYDETQELLEGKRQNERTTATSGYDNSQFFFTLGKWALIHPSIQEHGWPRPFLVRSLPLVPGDGSLPVVPYPRQVEPFEYVSWIYASNWPTTATKYRIHPGNLVLCMLVWLAAVIGVAIASEWWIRKRGGLLRFRLIDLLGAATIVALVVGWWSYHSRVHRIEDQVIDKLMEDRKRASPSFRSEYVGPVWLARLVGDDHSLPHLWHITYLDRRLWANWREQLDQIARLSYLSSLRLRGQIPAEAVEHLQAIERLQSLLISRYPDTRQEPLPIDKSLLPANLDRLACLQLQDISLEWPGLLIEDVELLLEATTPKWLGLRNPTTTVDELEELRTRYPNVELSVVWNLPYEFDSQKAVEAIDQVRRNRGL